MKKPVPVFCLTLALFLSPGPAWSQTKSEKGNASWLKGVRASATRVVARYSATITAFAKRYDIPSEWLGGIMLVESSGDARVPGGLMQAGESAKRATGIWCDTRDPRCSIEISAAYLRELRKMYGNNWPRIVLAYNRGPGGVRKVRDPYRHQYLSRFTYALVVYNDACAHR